MQPSLRLAHACLVSSTSLFLWVGSIHLSQAQTSTSSSPSPTSNSASKPEGFAIESEMMTYSAMDAEGQAVACGIARNLGAVDDKCTPKGMSGPQGGVIVVAAPSSALAEFQVWRTDLSTMVMLTARAEHYCPKAGQRGSSSSLGSTILSMFPASQAMTFAQALLTTTSESSPVQGNILDTTLINDVSGHLRSLGVPVILPDTYMPHSLAAIDQRRSPFLAKFGDLLKARACLDPEKKDQAKDGSSGDDQNKGTEDEKQVIATVIDDFVKSMSESAMATGPKPADSTAPQPTISHLNAVLRADGLAQELGVSSDSGEGGGWYLLSLKALESGGTQLKSGNAIRGTKTSYSGGSVGTYALFRLTGSVVCSGVFYNYGGALESTKIPKMLEGNQALPQGRLVGGCATGQ
jgi:hypothetical protein